MKKIMLLLTILLMSTLSSCSFIQHKSVSEISDAISNSRNYKITATVDVSLAAASFVAEVDSNKIHYISSSGFLGMTSTNEYYIATERTGTYKYTVYEDGTFDKELCTEEDEQEQELFTFWQVLFDEKCYTYNASDNTYYMRDDRPITDEDGNLYTDAKIKIGENEEYYTISFYMINSGIFARYKIVISDIGKVSIVLPQVE